MQKTRLRKNSSSKRMIVGIEILSIMGWVCVWEATSIIVMQSPELQRLWFNLDRLTKSEIIFKTADDKKDSGSEE